MRRSAKYIFLISLLLWTGIVAIYHAGVYPKPKVDLNQAQAKAEWLDRRQHGVHHLILHGAPFPRGKRAGELTGHLLEMQEDQLLAKLNKLLPSPALVQVMIIGAITWFQGVEDYLEPAWLEEMYGTGLGAAKRFEYLADGFTRQVAYHGLHEVGQMMVDQGVQDMGCTLVAAPLGKSWVIGRNFDFEGGRVFDSEKIVKWTFPEKGNAFVSVIFAGLVGTVTGVNDKGLYISLNAAGSDDHRRLGTPSTLLITKALQEASNSEEAIEILRKAQMFITDIFVILDAQGNLYRVEKSPARFSAKKEIRAMGVANHLVSEEFMGDRTNEGRKKELTTVPRTDRALELVRKVDPNDKNIELKILAILRDKGVDMNGKPLHLTNRRAIDALIATHSVIYNPLTGVLFVSQGPSVSGPFLGYDLKKSFATQSPVAVKTLPRDPLVSDELYERLKDAAHKISDAHGLIRKRRCQAGRLELDAIEPDLREQGPYFHALGDAHACAGESEKARSAWMKALALVPAYASERDDLEKKLNP